MSRAIEQSVKDQLRNLVEEEGKTFVVLWKRLLMERFLVRLSKSDFQDKLIFKGGLLLAQYIDIGRETIDLDFLARKIKNEEDKLVAMIQSILEVPCNDGFRFSTIHTRILNQPHMPYPGYRLTVTAHLGSMRDTLSIDIGVGDPVVPRDLNIRLSKTKNGAIFEDEITLKAYPPEAIFAEKLEALLSRGANNSRMKDFHDLTMMIRERGLLEESRLQETILTVFGTRGTPLEIPIHFGHEQLAKLQGLWTQYYRGLGQEAQKRSLPKDLDQFLEELNAWLDRNIAQKEIKK